MSFSAATCLSYTGTTSLTDPITIYSNTDSYYSPFTSITLNQITSGNCPLILTGIPDGTTTLRLHSSNNYCCDIVLECNDLCTTCNLNFDSFTSTTIGNIVVGNLTGSCDNPITDYVINWYGPSETASPRSTNIARISGKGSAFPYNYQHPLTGINSLPVEEGYYIPVIDKVRINGVDFSFTGGTGYVPANLECFDGIPVYVSGYTCDNGVESGDYTHRVNFHATGNGVPPKALTSTFKLSASTNFFAWKFKGEGVPDQLKLTFYGSSYGLTPIILEWWEVGNLSTPPSDSQDITIFPKSADTIDFINKVTTLTGFTINDGDRIVLEVIPSTTNFTTNWDFYFTCLDTFDCGTCFDSYENQSYKLIGSQITGVTGSCNTISIQLPISGCSVYDLVNSDLYKYYGINSQDGFYNNGWYFAYSDTFYSYMNWGSTFCYEATSSINPGNCSSSTNYISFTKDNSGVGGTGVINMNFSGATAITDFNKFYNTYQTLKSGIYSGSTDPTNYTFYRYFVLTIPQAIGDDFCGDGSLYYQYNIHYPTAVVTTGLTFSGVYTLSITMPTITKGIFPIECESGCDSSLNFICNISNNSSTGATNVRSLISNRGNSYDNPYNIIFLVSGTTTSSTAYKQGYLNRNVNSFNTIPSSGSSYTIIPSLSGQVCDYSLYGSYNTDYTPPYLNGQYYYRKDFYQIKVQLTNISDVRDFDIYMSPINNFTYSGFPSSPYYELAYSYSGGSVVYSNPTYVI